MLSDICQVVSNSTFPNLVAFACAVHVSAASGPDQVLRDAFQDVCVRFNTFLMRQHRAGHPSKGLLVIDQSHEDRYRRLIEDFRRSGTQWGYLGNIVDIPYFASRRDTRLLQLADFCANAVFDTTKPAIPVSSNSTCRGLTGECPDTPPDGLKHITRAACQCEACNWR